MNILVIGGAGYIGSHVVHELCDQKYNVTVLDNLSTGFLSNLDKRADFIEDSFTNISNYKILKSIDCVIHLAALKAAGESMDNPIKYSKQNIINSIELINTCIKYEIKNFIFSSSAAVYGYPKYLPIDENHDLNPINYYGFSKLMIEEQLLWYNKLKDLNIALLRYFNAAGYDIKQRIKNKENNPQNLIPIVMEVASGERDKLNIFGGDYNTPDGTCLRDYIHVNDLARGHVKAIEMLKNNNKKIITNLATGNYHSVLDVVNKTSEIINKEINYSIVDRRAGDPDKLFAKSNNVLNHKNKYSDLDTIINSTWRIYKD
ncbi:UDP-glucose 4-epimerase GalE [bacterium]|nr:UDP-glucose 4-epimerase GalE [bacterium]